MFYSIRLRGMKEEQGLATIGHLEIFSKSSGERQRKSREVQEVQEVQEVLERQNRSR